MSKSSNITINTEFSVVTTEINSTIFSGFIKYLLLFENVIPFRYENFKYYAELFRKQVNINNDNWTTALIDKQRESVIQISDDITNLLKVNCLNNE